MKNIIVLLKFTLMVLSVVLYSATSAQAQTTTLVKEFLSEPVQGATVEIKYTLSNNIGSFLQNVSFSDDLDATLTGMISLGGTASSCGGLVSGTSTMSFSRTFMPGNSECSFTVLAQLAPDAVPGTYMSTTSVVNGSIFLGASFSDPGVSADLNVRSILAFEKSFIDDPVNSGGSVTIEFSLTNRSALSQLSDINFTDDLDAEDAALVGLVANDLPLIGICGTGNISGTDVLTFVDGRLLPLQSCSFQVQLVLPAGVPMGSYTNKTSVIGWSKDLGINSYASPAASDDLSVGLPVLTKAFTDDPVLPGEGVSLEFTITNINPTESFTNIGFTDDLDAALSGLDVQTLPSNGFCGLGSTISGTNELTIAGGSLAPLASCTFSIDLNVPNNAPSGTHLSTSSKLSVESATMETHVSESASDHLNVIGIPVLTKTFTNDPVAPGEQVTLEFSISNFSRSDSSTNISFTDDLDTTLSGLVATGLPLVDACGAGSTLSGTSLLSLVGAELPPQGSCTFSVTLDVPTNAPTGTYLNTSSALTSNVGGNLVIGGTASDSLVIEPATLISIDWSDDPVAAGSTATLDITLTNSSLSDTASDISFAIPFDVSLPTLAAGPVSTCDGDATFTQRFNPPPPDDTIPAHLDYGFVTPGTLAPGASCTIQVVLNVASDMPTGLFPHSASGVTSTVDMIAYTGPPASDTLAVVGGPTLSMVFTDDPTLPGDSVNLELTLTHESLVASDATNIGFSIDLDGVILGMVGSGLPQSDVCGVGSTISGTGLLTFTGGTLTPAASCTFSIQVDVPLGITPNSYIVESSAVIASVSGLSVTGSIGSGELRIAEFIITKEFLTNPVFPGEQVVLEYTFTNLSQTEAANLFLPFNDDLDSALFGLSAISLPPDGICGAASSVTGAGVLALSGISIDPNSTCSLQVTLQVPTGAQEGVYTSASASQFVFLGPDFVTGAPAVANLEVKRPLSLTKSFIDDPVASGSNVILEFAIFNHSGTHSITDIAFTDDLNTVLAGLTFDSVVSDTCAAAIVGTASTMIDISNISLTAGNSCTIQVSLSVPAMTTNGSYTNTTSDITGMISGIAITGSAASDDFSVVNIDVSFSKAFSAGSAEPGDTVSLSFFITNNLVTDSALGLAFSDDLDAAFSGLIATGLPVNDVCGIGSVLSGTSFLTVTGASLSPQDSCVINLNVVIPPIATNTIITNTTSDLTSNGLFAAAPAVALIAISDTDYDDDGILNESDNCPNTANADQADLDLDGAGDVCDSDIDGDGLPNDFENENGLNPFNSFDQQADPDGDGFTNLEEYQFGTDPNSADVDRNGNGIPDIVDLRRSIIAPAILDLLLLGDPP